MSMKLNREVWGNANRASSIGISTKSRRIWETKMHVQHAGKYTHTHIHTRARNAEMLAPENALRADA